LKFFHAYFFSDIMCIMKCFRGETVWFRRTEAIWPDWGFVFTIKREK